VAPRLPKAVFSVLGNLPLKKTKDGLDDTDFGEFLFQERLVKIRPGLSPDMEWPTYWHEAAHVALYDAGVSHQLSEKQEEAICDAMGTYLSAMMRAGMLKVVTPKT
jgi:hypothetical protein